MNLAKRLFASNHDIFTRITFGKKFADQERFRIAIKEGTDLAAGFHIGDFFPSLAFISLISGMKGRSRRSLLDVLLQFKDNGGLDVPLTVDNIKSVILDLFVGGTENSSNTVEWAMSELIKNPGIMEKAQAEDGLMPPYEETDDIKAPMPKS
ncbi:hypothetical protein F0562_013457 [Nyssa sinensis]|uniref:Cytochrome P450 n=1 Tax=Nyssa sinensis TaxID=561372 RepID=A0A5J4ZQ61_9ASTE|nr:hypothetical protein F0562_013457 [Nyssa sinensis]